MVLVRECSSEKDFKVRNGERARVLSLIEKIKEKKEVKNALLAYFGMKFKSSKYLGCDFEFLRRKYADLIKQIYRKNIVAYYIEMKALLDSKQMKHPVVSEDLKQEVELLERIFKKVYNYSPA